MTAGNAPGDGEGLAVRLGRWADGLGCVEWAVRWLVATINLAHNLATEPWRLAGLSPSGGAAPVDRP